MYTVHVGNAGSFEIRVGVHHGSCLSPWLLIIVMCAISKHVRRKVPTEILYADDLIVADKGKAGIQTRFPDWQSGRGHWRAKYLKININKTENMVCAKTNETLMRRDRTGHNHIKINRNTCISNER